MLSTYLKSGDSVLKVLGTHEDKITVINLSRPYSAIYEITTADKCEEADPPLMPLQNDDELYDWQKKKRDQRFEIIEFIIREENWWTRENRKSLIAEAASRFLISPVSSIE